MLKNFDREIKEADGTDYLEAKATGKFSENGQTLFEAENGVAKMYPVTFGKVIGNILKTSTKDENLNSDEYIERWGLMQSLAKGGDIELSGKQISTLRDLLVKAKLPAFIVGQICLYLNEATPTD
jgi:hypothetical protein